eukprot:247638-Alexandrium_andersonii.AAC.1
MCFGASVGTPRTGFSRGLGMSVEANAGVVGGIPCYAVVALGDQRASCKGVILPGARGQKLFDHRHFCIGFGVAWGSK